MSYKDDLDNILSKLDGVLIKHKQELEKAYGKGWDAAMKERDEEMIRFAEWVAQSDYTYSPSTGVWFIRPIEHMPTTSELLEKFQSLPPIPPKQ